MGMSTNIMAAPLLKVSSHILRESSIVLKGCSHFHTQHSPLLFKASQQLWGEPMKRKKKVDPAIIAAKEAKKIKKIDKEIKRMLKFGRILKPVAEIENINKKLINSKECQRPSTALSFEESERRVLLHKQWSGYKARGWYTEYKQRDRLQASQQEALESLREESEELYQEAIKIDYSFVPLSFSGPKDTPPIKDFRPTDGEYWTSHANIDLILYHLVL